MSEYLFIYYLFRIYIISYIKSGTTSCIPQSFEMSLFKLRVMLLFIIAQCKLARTSYDSLKMKIDYNTKRKLFSKCKFKIEENKNVFYFSTAAPAFSFFVKV